MHITGFDKLSLLNYPEKVACTVFTPGCNFRCPFCHNASIVDDKYKRIEEESIFKYLDKRKNIIEGVCITGGEPLIQTGIEDFIKKIKDRGLKVKIDTNGYLPEKLKSLIEKNLVDYVAMDIKNSDEKYSATSGAPCFDIERINQSIRLLINGSVKYEFRTTLVKEYHEESDIKKMCKKIQGASSYFLQNFVDSGDTIQNNLHGFGIENLNKYLNIAKNYINNANLRGV